MTYTRRAALRTLGLGALAAATTPVSAVPKPVSSLQLKINQYIKQQRRLGYVARDELTSWSVYDFNSATKLVAINEDIPRQAASMIKPFVAQAYFYQHLAHKQRYPLTGEVQDLMEGMIRYSKNGATNELIARTSRAAYGKRPQVVEYILKRHARWIFPQTRIVEYIPKGGRSYRNMASAHDYSRFLFALWTERLPFAAELKYLLSLPNADRIQKGTATVPETVNIFDKTGSTARLCGNMGIIVPYDHNGQAYPYTMIGIIQKGRRAIPYRPWIRSRGDIIRGVSDLVYSEMKARHGIA